MDLNKIKPERSDIEKVMGRRLRPWWGQAPGRLITRGVAQGAIFGIVGYGCIQVLTGNFNLGNSELADQQRWIELAATVGLVLVAIGIVYSVLRIVIGGIDVSQRTTVEGVLLHARRRQLGDVLPGPVRWVIEARRRRRSDVDHYRRTRLELVIATPDGPKSWNVRHKHFHESFTGRRVRLTATPLLGHVRNVVAIADPSSVSGSWSDR